MIAQLTPIEETVLGKELIEKGIEEGIEKLSYFRVRGISPDKSSTQLHGMGYTYWHLGTDWLFGPGSATRFPAIAVWRSQWEWHRRGRKGARSLAWPVNEKEVHTMAGEGAEVL